MRTETNNIKQLTIRVPEEVHRAMKLRAAEEGKSVAAIVEGLIREYLVRGPMLGNVVSIGGRNHEFERFKREFMGGEAYGLADFPGGATMSREKPKKVKGNK